MAFAKASRIIFPGNSWRMLNVEATFGEPSGSKKQCIFTNRF
jgi:hypothetical protein